MATTLLLLMTAMIAVVTATTPTNIGEDAVNETSSLASTESEGYTTTTTPISPETSSVTPTHVFEEFPKPEKMIVSGDKEHGGRVVLTTAVPETRVVFDLVHSHYHHDTKWGPYFEDRDDLTNISARLGSTVLMDCKIGMLQDKTVSWLRRKGDSLQLLTVGKLTYSSDSRISLAFRYPNNWRLEIRYVSRRDEGRYECQISTHPPRVHTVFLRVSAPELRLLDEHGQVVAERYYKAGSSIELTCEVTQADDVSDAVGWFLGERLLTTVNTREGLSVDGNGTVALLTVHDARKQDSGNYTCRLGTMASATVAVHVLNGELPAAVQHEDTNVAAIASCTVNVCVWLWISFIPVTRAIVTIFGR